MIVEDQLDRGAPRINGVKKSEEFDELAAAVAVSDESVDLAGEQINPSQQAELVPCRLYSWSRAKLAWMPGSGEIRRRRCDGLDSRLFSSHDTIAIGFPRLFDLAGAFFRTATITIDAQDLGHLPFELSIAIFKLVAHLVRLDFLLAEDLAHRSLDQIGQACMPCRRPVFARMARQQPRRPQLMWIAVVLRLVTRQRHQPGFGLRRDGWFPAGSRAIVEGGQRAIGQRSLDTALHGLMMDSKSLAHCAKRRILAIRQQHLRPRHPARQFSSRPRKRRQCCYLFVGHRQLDRSPPSSHDTAPRFADRKRGIRQLPVRSTHSACSSIAGFMESIAHLEFKVNAAGELNWSATSGRETYKLTQKKVGSSAANSKR
ncbi:hypothetical protein [Bradyrhizobium sp. CSA207]|uniref:hypothetical protein n=1 Tax=Bradyrhizobium sp. CSA207 TaxID=2698826 RepID=UPI0023AFB86E|nr:hypothetical protein [Bradyrhizobium sp. CSA207]